jgi:glutathione synthase/RimK-type ligase-like ATP-grasp enzyme
MSQRAAPRRTSEKREKAAPARKSDRREKVVGLLVGRENTFPQPFIDAVNQKGSKHGVRAEMALLGGAREVEEPPYAVVVDRISHEVPYYRGHLKSMAAQGTVIVNDPFWWDADEKFYECTLARGLGVAVPRTVLLPNKAYIPDITAESLRNLRYPLDWDALLTYVGLPAILKPNVGGGWKDVYKVDSKEELLWAYDQTDSATFGQRPKTMILQEFIRWQDYIRCVCIGRKEIRPIRYDPTQPHFERYVLDRPLPDDLRDRAIRDARTLVNALGYDMNTVEFAVRDGVLYAIDFLNPAPDFDSFSIREENFAWVVDHMSDLVLEYARGRAKPPWRGEHGWWRHVRA